MTTEPEHDHLALDPETEAAAREMVERCWGALQSELGLSATDASHFLVGAGIDLVHASPGAAVELSIMVNHIVASLACLAEDAEHRGMH